MHLLLLLILLNILHAQFFAVYVGHGDVQVVEYRQTGYTPRSPRSCVPQRTASAPPMVSSLDSKKQRENTLLDCFCRVNAAAEAPVFSTSSSPNRPAPETHPTRL